MEADQIKIIQGWPADLSQIAAFLDTNWDYDTMSAALLEEKLMGDPLADPKLCFSAIEGEKLVGFLYCVQRKIRGLGYGYIKLFAVDKDYRRHKIGSRLYKQAEVIMRKKGTEIIRWYDVPLNYFMPGIDPRYTEALCFAQHHGFLKFEESVNMLCDLNAMDWSTQQEEEKLKAKGVEVRRATKKDKAAIMELLSQEWILWNNEVNMAMKDNPPSIYLAFLNEKLLSFSAHNGNNKGTGWFGPMGTHPDMRGMGIGSILLKRCLQDMKEQGHSHAIIPWVAPIAFYSHFAKAKINRVFWRMEKKFEKE